MRPRTRSRKPDKLDEFFDELDGEPDFGQLVQS